MELSSWAFEIKQKELKENSFTFIESILNYCANTAIHHPWKVILVSILVFAGSIQGATQLSFSHNPLNWLPDDLEARLAVEQIDEKMGGSIPVEIVIDTGVVEGLYNPAVLTRLEELTVWLENYETDDFKVAKASGLTFMVKESHRALNEGRQEFYKIPKTREIIAQEMFMFENSGPDELAGIVDSQFQETRLAVIMPWIDTTLYKKFLEDIQTEFDNKFGPLATTTITGLVPVLGNTLYSVIRTMVQSYAIAFFVIAIMMIVLLSSVKYGLVAMFPNLLPVVAMLGVMHYLSIPLDLFTILVGSIAMGIAVDDTVHFMHHFMRYFGKVGNAEEAVRLTLNSSGRAMITTSIVLCVGFSMLMFSSMVNIQNFGFLIAFTIFIALVADFLLAPALMIIMNKAKAKIET